jgi:hypothetical protein
MLSPRRKSGLYLFDLPQSRPKEGSHEILSLAGRVRGGQRAINQILEGNETERRGNTPSPRSIDDFQRRETL